MAGETAMRTGGESGGRAPGIGRPLIGSAAGHLFLLSLLLLAGAAAGPGAGGVVQVILVEGAGFDYGDEESPAGSSGGARREAIPTGVAKTPQGSLSASPAPPTLPSLGPVSTSPMSPASQSPVPGALPGGAEPVPPIAAPSAGARDGMPREEGDSAAGQAGGLVTRPALPPAYAFGEGGDGNGGAEIRRLRERIESRIVYPEDAIRRGQEGEVLLRIRVGEGGVPQEIRVARSSGAKTLDEAACNGVARAAPLPSLPGWFEVPIRFSLRRAW